MPQPAGQAAAPPANPAAPAQAEALTAYARQYNLIIRSAPDLGAQAVATLAWNNPVTLICHTTGPRSTSFNGGRTETWDKVRTPDGVVGYVSDGWVLTSAEVDQLVPAC